MCYVDKKTHLLHLLSERSVSDMENSGWLNLDAIAAFDTS